MFKVEADFASDYREAEEIHCRRGDGVMHL